MVGFLLPDIDYHALNRLQISNLWDSRMPPGSFVSAFRVDSFRSAVSSACLSVPPPHHLHSAGAYSVLQIVWHANEFRTVSVTRIKSDRQ